MHLIPRVIPRVIPQCASHLAALDDIQAGKQSQDKIKWSDTLIEAFKAAQTAINSTHTITLPCPGDQLWIVTDGSVKKEGIGATLYITRDGVSHIAGFFSAKLRGRQVTWLPCEIEALSIAVATKHFSPYIIQSFLQIANHVYKLSKSCVEASFHPVHVYPLFSQWLVATNVQSVT